MNVTAPEEMRAIVDVCTDCDGDLATCQAAPVKCCPDCQHYKPLMVALRAAADEIDRLRKVIEGAPHDHGLRAWCQAGYSDAPCTCWKADAL